MTPEREQALAQFIATANRFAEVLDSAQKYYPFDFDPLVSHWNAVVILEYSEVRRLLQAADAWRTWCRENRER